MQKNLIFKHFEKHGMRNILVFLASFCIIFAGIGIIWISSFKVPSLDTIQARKIGQSTKIYDNTGKVLLFDVYQNAKRTIIPFEEISQKIKDATLSIEDKDFYTHKGFKPTSFIRAILANALSGEYSQGGSTVTQQVVKNSILTGDKSFLGGPARKLKEIALSLKIERVLSKDQILGMYLNENPYGGTIYGVEEASQAFFGKSALDVSLAEAAYLAAIPQAPSKLSPYGQNKDLLEKRKNLVIDEMVEDGKITEEEGEATKKEAVTFLPKSNSSIKAPHFVLFVRDYLEKKYGKDVLEQGGLRVTTTLNYELQAKAEEIALKYAEINEKNFNGENDAFVALDPRTGGILTMVGSRNYSDEKIDGQFNVTTAHRQPGSTFKPFVYAQAFAKGFTPETVLFDVKTQFSTACPKENLTSEGNCYSPNNYDDNFRGPMTMREALAQSINVPAVKTLYLAGIADSINLARSMGISTLTNANQYGLTLVLGGGEVSLLEMVSAYGVFATEGIRNPYISILKVETKDGQILEEAKMKPVTVLDPEVTRKISDILSDNVARTPLYGANSLIYFADRDVAVKTGTTNDYKDAWTIGYTPNVVVGTWAGNNDNTSMEKKVSGLIVAPMWRAFMDEVLKTVPPESFTKPQREDSYELKPVLRGKWQGGISSVGSNGTPTDIPYDSVQETLSGGVHSILYWLNKNSPREGSEIVPENDSQFERWEYGVRQWAEARGM